MRGVSVSSHLRLLFRAELQVVSFIRYDDQCDQRVLSFEIVNA